MKLIRYKTPKSPAWASTDPFEMLNEEFRRLFTSPDGPFVRQSRMLGDWAPALDVEEQDDAFVVYAELPGMKREAIDISLNNGLLVIQGERTEEKPSQGQSHRTERYYGKFSRTVSLPSEVDADKVTATYRDGVLLVRLPKAEQAKPRQIEVTAH